MWDKRRNYFKTRMRKKTFSRQIGIISETSEKKRSSAQKPWRVANVDLSRNEVQQKLVQTDNRKDLEIVMKKEVLRIDLFDNCLGYFSKNINICWWLHKFKRLGFIWAIFGIINKCVFFIFMSPIMDNKFDKICNVYFDPGFIQFYTNFEYI